MANDHYYTKEPQSAHHEAYVEMNYRGHALRFETDSGVFSKTELDRGTQILLDALPEAMSGDVLDMGCGWGAIGISLAIAFSDVRVCMTDINERACLLSRKNAERARVQAEVLQSDGWEMLSERLFDHIVQNPPIRAGKAVIYAMFSEAAKHLKPGGILWLVIRKQQGAPSAKTYLETLFHSVEVPEKEAGYWIFRCTEPIG